MTQNRSPGNFILEAADTGLAAVASVSYLGPSQKIKKLAAKISLSASLLTTVGREVNKHEGYFKDNFPEKFEILAVKCQKEYEKILAGIEKSNSWKEGDSGEEADKPPKQQWKKLMWALGLKEDGMYDLEESLNKAFHRAVLLKGVVFLVVLQMHGQERDLTPSEQRRLRWLKMYMGDFLDAFRDENIASVVAFSLGEASNVANATQVAEALQYAIEEDMSMNSISYTTSSVTIRNPSKEAIPSPVEKRPAGPPEISPTVDKELKLLYPDKFEMYQVGDVRKTANRTSCQLFGIPFKIDRGEAEPGLYLSKVPATQEDIEIFMENNKIPGLNEVQNHATAFQDLVNLHPSVSTSIYVLINDKNAGNEWRGYKWSVECLVPMAWKLPTIGREKAQGGRFRKKQNSKKRSSGYIIILRGTFFCQPPPVPPPPNWPYGPRGHQIILKENAARRGSRKYSRKEKEEKKPAAHIELTQQETETVINDFLASFSTLYDGIPIEERGAALKAIELPGEDDSEYDDDDSSTSSDSRSLVDD